MTARAGGSGWRLRTQRSTNMERPRRLTEPVAASTAATPSDWVRGLRLVTSMVSWKAHRVRATWRTVPVEAQATAASSPQTTPSEKMPARASMVSPRRERTR